MLGIGQRHALAIIIHQHQIRDVLRHIGKDLIALSICQFPRAGCHTEENLDVHLMV